MKTPPRLEQPSSFGESRAKVRRSLRELAISNQFLQGTRSILQNLTPLLLQSPEKEHWILDVGTGAGDIPRALVKWARAHNIRCRVVAFDRHPQVVAQGARLSQDFPEITHMQGDVFTLPFLHRSFDFVISSMLIHYFPLPDAARMMAGLVVLARNAVVIADVERHWVPYQVIEKLSRLFRDRVIRRGFNDSVLRGFTPDEMHELASGAGLERCHVRRYFPYRLAVTGHIRSG